MKMLKLPLSGSVLNIEDISNIHAEVGMPYPGGMSLVVIAITMKTRDTFKFPIKHLDGTMEYVRQEAERFVLELCQVLFETHDMEGLHKLDVVTDDKGIHPKLLESGE